MQALPDRYAPMTEYLAAYSDALYYHEELPVMDDAKLTPSQQARLGNFLLKADAGGRMIQRHNRNLDRRDALATQSIEQGEQV